MIPIIGKYIDGLGVRPISIISDVFKITRCLFLLYAILRLDDDSSQFWISWQFNFYWRLQTLISYEKMIASISNNKEHHINMISRMDFRIIIGPLIGIFFIDYGYKYLLVIPVIFYFINALFFLFFYKEKKRIHENNSQEIISSNKMILYILSSPIILFSIFIAIGNNMFDGLIESSGTALIDRSMKLPIKYYGFIDIAAGICGVLGTYLYSYLSQCIRRRPLTIISISIIVISSSFLVFFQGSMILFFISYAISIIGKVFSGNILRMLRIEIIPFNQLASVSSLIILLNQLILPIVGGLLFFSTGDVSVVYMLMIVAIAITLISGGLLVMRLKQRVISS
ncbi:MFS transporter [Proteus vulgaris]